MITIKTRIERNSVEDKIYLGMLVEKVMGSEFGGYVRLLWDGMQRAILDQSRASGVISAERFLGRLEAIQIMRDELEMLVQVKNQLVEEKREDNKVQMAEE